MSSNGRVNIKGDNTIALFSMKDKIPVHSQSNSYTNAMTGTWDNTMFHTLKVGEKVNLEFDIIGKYISKLIKK